MSNKDYEKDYYESLAEYHAESRYRTNDTMRQLHCTPLFDGMSEKNQGDLAKRVNDIHSAFLPDFMGSGGDRNTSRLLMSCIMDACNLGRLSAKQEREQAYLDRNLAQLKAKVEKAKAKEEANNADEDLFVKAFQGCD